MSAYGNKVIDLPGVHPGVVKIAAERLMPPQYDEFCAAMRGETSEATQDYWQEKAEMFSEIADEAAQPAAPNFTALKEDNARQARTIEAMQGEIAHLRTVEGCAESLGVSVEALRAWLARREAGQG